MIINLRTKQTVKDNIHLHVKSKIAILPVAVGTSHHNKPDVQKIVHFCTNIAASRGKVCSKTAGRIPSGTVVFLFRIVTRCSTSRVIPLYTPL
jgi:hypothetical protein